LSNGHEWPFTGSLKARATVTVYGAASLLNGHEWPFTGGLKGHATAIVSVSAVRVRKSFPVVPISGFWLRWCGLY
jgi:hypothetical protein